MARSDSMISKVTGLGGIVTPDPEEHVTGNSGGEKDVAGAELRRVAGNQVNGPVRGETESPAEVRALCVGGRRNEISE